MKQVVTSIQFLLIVGVFTGAVSCNSGAPRQEQAATATADSAGSVKLQMVTTQLTTPVAMAVANDNTQRVFISDLDGNVWILENGRIKPKPFIDISGKLEKKDTSLEVRGMFSMAFHPQFAQNRKFYMCYNAPANNKKDACKLVISEFMASATNPDSADLKSEHIVFELEGEHVGTYDDEISFGPDGYLYTSIGDHDDIAVNRKAQDLHSLQGKLLRIDVDKSPYAIPADNPFVNDKNARPEIWAYGFRRLWRFSFDTESNTMFGADVGDKKQEEVDVIERGGNYGWPVKEGDSSAGNMAVTNASFIAPVSSYTHQVGICAIGGYVYHGSEVPSLQNKYVFADFNGNLFTLVKKDVGQWTRTPVNIENKPADPFLIFSCGMDKNKELYLLGVLNSKDGYKGIVYKIVKS